MKELSTDDGLAQFQMTDDLIAQYNNGQGATMSSVAAAVWKQQLMNCSHLSAERAIIENSGRTAGLPKWNLADEKCTLANWNQRRSRQLVLVDEARACSRERILGQTHDRVLSDNHTGKTFSPGPMNRVPRSWALNRP